MSWKDAISKRTMPLDGMEEETAQVKQELLQKLKAIRAEVHEFGMDKSTNRRLKFERKVLLDLDKAIAGLTNWK